MLNIFPPFALLLWYFVDDKFMFGGVTLEDDDSTREKKVCSGPDKQRPVKTLLCLWWIGLSVVCCGYLKVYLDHAYGGRKIMTRYGQVDVMMSRSPFGGPYSHLYTW